MAFGSIVGNVTDASGGGMAGAGVKITLIQTNDSRSVMTNDDWRLHDHHGDPGHLPG